MVRLSAGRLSISPEAQALAFLAGANSIFTGEKLLTTPNPEHDFDQSLLATLGMHARVPGKEASDHHHGTAAAGAGSRSAEGGVPVQVA
jgi:biotin synthase